ncbi:hypothetical protein SJA_C1-14060 [Sphingobium indicum UT26S]|uniref:Uncharacterized protein n=1 Tax=Sphingobium indicum (strain DSM 16413 / CCM 7287 / MTCC 6362 / UT26 / NBRC 101211 / UT26S) TaxID=452662 RepID=D4Z0V8_SPHIU|nr:hypothetical protein SJA_C1-14060 [Sphingobium indicum UT26S]
MPLAISGRRYAELTNEGASEGFYIPETASSSRQLWLQALFKQLPRGFNSRTLDPCGRCGADFGTEHRAK